MTHEYKPNDSAISSYHISRFCSKPQLHDEPKFKYFWIFIETQIFEHTVIKIVPKFYLLACLVYFQIRICHAIKGLIKKYSNSNRNCNEILILNEILMHLNLGLSCDFSFQQEIEKCERAPKRTRFWLNAYAITWKIFFSSTFCTKCWLQTVAIFSR